MDLTPTFRDNMDDKVVYLQSAGRDADYRGGERHAFLFWDMSKPNMPGLEVQRMVHLTGAYGDWAMAIETKRRRPDYKVKNEVRALGMFTRAQRDRILMHARTVDFEPRSRVNSCRTWLRDLLKLLVGDAYLPFTRAQFDVLDAAVPLLRRVREQ
ncbi:hypothetical protein PENSPDRAFT_621678 [Peniophora sp. CONT]|nr:hypothetical protein PENSPDRAFT_621678 [Peniophora sp. CONT]